MKPTVLVAKGGSVFRTRDHSALADGEQGETEGLIRHLAERDDIHLVYFGQWRGEPIDNVTIVESYIEDLDEWATKDEQIACHEVDLKNLADHDVIGFINVAGYAPTSSLVWNPMGATCQAASVRYSGPMLQVMASLEIPRIVVNCDPRTVPRDQEMTWFSDWIRPRVMLGQWSKWWDKVVGGTRYRVYEVQGFPQSWGYLEERENTDEHAAVIVAHAHFSTGIKNGDPARWQIILRDLPGDCEIFGKGWESYDGDIPWCGPLKPQEVLDQFRIHTCGPIVPHTYEYLTGKPYVMMSQGCIPLFSYEYDIHEELMPHSHELRIRREGDFSRLAMKLHLDVDFRREMRAEMKCILRPRWETIDYVVDHLVKHRGIDVSNGFGGYERF